MAVDAAEKMNIQSRNTAHKPLNVLRPQKFLGCAIFSTLPARNAYRFSFLLYECVFRLIEQQRRVHKKTNRF
jgi:hypothetical protein